MRRYEIARFIRTARLNESKPHILYVSNGFEAKSGQTVRYRVKNPVEALRGRAYALNVFIESSKAKNEALIQSADIIILSRLYWSNDAAALLMLAEKYAVPVVFDIDDIIFLPSFVEHYCRVLGDTSEKNIKLRLHDFNRFKKLFARCRYATASTCYIADLMQKEGKTSYVIHNSLNRKQLQIARRRRKWPRKGKVRYIGYLSGTKTHDRDFQQVIPALTRIVEEYEDVRLNIVGYLDVDALPEKLKKKTETHIYMRWERLLSHSARNYINIAPLDVGNPFCHAKSELKYFEAAVVGVPTIASPTDTFKRCIVNGVNGLLAASEEEWYTAIKSLLDDANLYDTIRTNALAHVKSHYTPRVIAQEALQAYQNIISDSKAKKEGLSEC